MSRKRRFKSYIYMCVYIYIYIQDNNFSDGVTPKTTHGIIGIQLKLSSSVLNVLGNCNSSLTQQLIRVRKMAEMISRIIFWILVGQRLDSVFLITFAGSPLRSIFLEHKGSTEACNQKRTKLLKKFGNMQFTLS